MNANVTITQSYDIVDDNFYAVATLVEKLNKRCVKLHLPQIELNVTNSYEKNDTIYHTVTLTGMSPRIAGFEFVASVDHITTEGNVINVCPFSLELSKKIGMEQYRRVDATCEHCKTLRARNSTYVVYNLETGIAKRVGKQCLKDFTGHSDVHAIAEYAQLLHEIDSNINDMDEESNSGTGNHTSLVNLLKWVACSIREHGWVSKGRAYEEYLTSTVSDALQLEDMLKNKTSDIQPTLADKELACKALEWVRSEEFASVCHENDYTYNLYVVCKDSIINNKHRGIAASLIVAYQKATQVKIEKTAKVESTYLVSSDMVGKKTTFVGTVTRINVVQTEYGNSFAITFLTDNGQKVTWFASNPFNKDNSPMCVEGNKYSVDCTVKALKDDAKWGKSTLVTRCKVRSI